MTKREYEEDIFFLDQSTVAHIVTFKKDHVIVNYTGIQEVSPKYTYEAYINLLEEQIERAKTYQKRLNSDD